MFCHSPDNAHLRENLNLGKNLKGLIISYAYLTWRVVTVIDFDLTLEGVVLI